VVPSITALNYFTATMRARVPSSTMDIRRVYFVDLVSRPGLIDYSINQDDKKRQFSLTEELESGLKGIY
jgi:hypothetical protein